MKASRGMGAVMPSKMPGKKIIHRKDKPQDVEMYAKGGKVGSGLTVTKGGTAAAMAKKLLAHPGKLTAADMYAQGGLYENIHKKQARIKAGSGEKMRPVGSKGAPTKEDFIKSAKTARKK
jgi:hypothetical protein